MQQSFIIEVYDPFLQCFIDWNPITKNIVNISNRIINKDLYSLSLILPGPMLEKFKSGLDAKNKIEECQNFVIPNSNFLRKRQFPFHSLAKNSIFFEDRVIGRTAISGIIQISIDYSNTEFSKKLTDKSITLKFDISKTVNDLLSDTFKLLFIALDNNLDLSQTKQETFILKVSELESYLIGQSYLYEYNSVYKSLKENTRLNLHIFVTQKAEITEYCYPFYQSKGETMQLKKLKTLMGRINPKQRSSLPIGNRLNKKIIIWRFPVDFSAKNDYRDLTEPQLSNKINHTLNMINNPISHQSYDDYASSSLTTPYSITILGFDNLTALIDFLPEIKKKDKDQIFSKKFTEVKRRKMLYDRPTAGKLDPNSFYLNFPEIVKAFALKTTKQRNPKELPLNFACSCILIHGNKEISASHNLYFAFKNTLREEWKAFFPAVTIDSLPLETRLQIVVYIVYNTKRLEIVGKIEIPVFDSCGYLMEGEHVRICFKWLEYESMA